MGLSLRNWGLEATTLLSVPPQIVKDVVDLQAVPTKSRRSHVIASGRNAMDPGPSRVRLET